MHRVLALAAAALLAVPAAPAAASHKRAVVGYRLVTVASTAVELAHASVRQTSHWQTEFGCALERLVTAAGRIDQASCQLWAYDPAVRYFTTQGQPFPLTRWGEDNWAARASMHSLPAAEDFRVCVSWTVLTGGVATSFRECSYQKLLDV